jgi:hypothetical protein
VVGRLLSRNIECPSDVRTDETDQALFAVVLHKAVGWLPETLWLRPDLREQVGGAARLIEKGVVCWLHRNRGLLRGKPIRMFEEGREVPTGRTK